MIKENQKLFNRINVISDGLIIFAMLPVAFWIRFYVLRGGIINVPLREYMRLDIYLTLLQLLTFACFGLYQSWRKSNVLRELERLWTASVLDFILLMSVLFFAHEEHYSREAFLIFFVLSVGLLSAKRIVARALLRRMRRGGYNQKHVIVLGGGHLAESYVREVRRNRDLGYQVQGYVASEESEAFAFLSYLGSFETLAEVLEQYRPDEVISGVEMEDLQRTPQIIAACEKAGAKLALIPFYAEYMSSRPHFDDLNGIPLLNIRRVPLDNWGNAFLKRLIDIVGSALILIVFSPLMLICAIGVKLSSPGPIIFKQKRIGLNKKPFMMYKFRSMRVNDREETGWSSQEDRRKTPFGSFIRKYSLDEFPQFWNVLKGDMSLVGPRPEVPYYVDQFKEQVPLYMVKHQVRPGITGWAQVNGFRGDTSIEARVRYDIYYIEHWSLWFDLKILWVTVFKGKFKNDEVLS